MQPQGDARGMPGGCKVCLDDKDNKLVMEALKFLGGKAGEYVLFEAGEFINLYCPGLISFLSWKVKLATLSGNQKVCLSDKNNSITLKSKGKIKIDGTGGVEIVYASDIFVKSGGNIYLNRS